MELPKSLKTIGPHIADETIVQSVATALHVSNQPITGQSTTKSSAEKNLGVYINPEQPLVQVSHSLIVMIFIKVPQTC